MTIQLKNIITAYPSLMKLCNKDLPVRISYQLARMIQAIQKEVDIFDEQRKSLCVKYGSPDETQPGCYKIDKDNVDIFSSEINDLENQTIDINVNIIKINPMTNDIGNMSAMDVANMSDFILFYHDTVNTVSEDA